MSIVHKKGKTNINNSSLFPDTFLNKQPNNYHAAKTNWGLKGHMSTNLADVHNKTPRIKHLWDFGTKARSVKLLWLTVKLESMKCLNVIRVRLSNK